MSAMAAASPAQPPDRIVFSSFHGLVSSGEGDLARADIKLVELRNLPRFGNRRRGSVAYFVRCILIDDVPARLLGALRVQSDQSGRPSFHGYAVATRGRDVGTLQSALDEIDELDNSGTEAEIERLQPNAAFFDRPPTGAVVQRYPNFGTALTFAATGLARDDVLGGLWRLSWIDDEHGTFVVFTDPQGDQQLDSSTLADIAREYDKMPAPMPSRALGSLDSIGPRVQHGEWSAQSGGASEFPEVFADDALPSADRRSDLGSLVRELERQVAELRRRVDGLERRDENETNVIKWRNRFSAFEPNKRRRTSRRGRSRSKYFMVGLVLVLAIIAAAVILLIYVTDASGPLGSEEPQLPLQEGASDAESTRSEGEPSAMPDANASETVAPGIELEDATAIDEPREEHASEP